jgi:hypothetical protein
VTSIFREKQNIFNFPFWVKVGTVGGGEQTTKSILA